MEEPIPTPVMSDCHASVCLSVCPLNCNLPLFADYVSERVGYTVCLNSITVFTLEMCAAWRINIFITSNRWTLFHEN